MKEGRVIFPWGTHTTGLAHRSSHRRVRGLFVERDSGLASKHPAQGGHAGQLARHMLPVENDNSV